jgi:hypothetical protein
MVIVASGGQATRSTSSPHLRQLQPFFEGRRPLAESEPTPKEGPADKRDVRPHMMGEIRGGSGQPRPGVIVVSIHVHGIDKRFVHES